jgi:CheY-like chemotaxis protein
MTHKNTETRQPPIALVVDDEPLVLLDTSDWVENAGYQVVEAHNADEALSILGRHPDVALLVTDIQMPGCMDGIALARHVGERWPHIGILVLSGAVIPLPGMLPKGARFLNKPVDEARAQITLREFQS